MGKRPHYTSCARRLALDVSCENGHLETVSVLLGLGANVESRVLDKTSTPLILASRCGHVAIVEMLILCKASLETPDRGESTALYVASSYGHFSVVELLLKHGARVEFEICGNRGYSTSRSALGIACVSRQTLVFIKKSSNFYWITATSMLMEGN